MSKASDRLKALQQRSAAYAAAPQPTAAEAPPPGASPTDDLANARAYFGVEPLDRLARGRTVERLPVGVIAPELHPEHRQPRLLPPPEELLVNGAAAPEYADLVTDLLDLGRSLQERQLQPIIVYPGASPAYPAARYLILVGHRRWTAAVLVGMGEISAIVVDPPDPAERVIAQYVENEERADFSDMERAWALLQMKRALGDAPWEAVEERFQMSRSRRQDLLRLTTFTTAQQTQLARLRLSETQLRPLHTAVRNNELGPAHVDSVLAKLVRPPAPAAEQPAGPVVDGPTIARLVAKARRAANVAAQAPMPQWLTALRDQLERTDKALQRARRRVGELSDTDASALQEQLAAISARMAELSAMVDSRNE